MADDAIPLADSPLVSLVIPVFDERESLAALHAEIREVAAANRLRVEVVFVDDGSTDGSWAVVADLAAKNPEVSGVRFRRNFGKAAALAAGFARAKGSTVVTLDADLQDDPHEIPRFLAALDGGLDVVSGWKKVRHDPWHKVLPSRVFNGMVSRLTGVKLHDHNCGMKAYRAEVLREVTLYGEMHRFVPVLAAGRGFRVGELVIQHRARKFGRSKYGWKRFVKGFLDLTTVKFLTTFGRRPQHLLGSWGLILGLIGLGGLAVSAVVPLLLPYGTGFMLGVAGGAISVLALLFGGQLLLTGLLAELVIARPLTDALPYSIAEQTPPTQDAH